MWNHFGSILESFSGSGNQMEPDGVWKAPGPFWLIKHMQSCGTPPFRCRVVNLERSNTVKTHTKWVVILRSGTRCTFYRPLIHRQDPYRMNLFGEYILKAKNSCSHAHEKNVSPKKNVCGKPHEKHVNLSHKKQPAAMLKTKKILFLSMVVKFIIETK